MLNELYELNEKIKEKTFPKKRFMYNSIKTNLLNKRIFQAIIGPRGVGKTVLLSQLLNEIDHSFYISLDAFDLDFSLFDIAKTLEEKGVKYLFLDEIHFYPNFSKEIKKIYDFLNLNIIFTGSVALSLHDSVYDLSRRVLTYTLYPFSFLEYIYFKKDILLDSISINEFINYNKAKQYYSKTFKYEFLFEDYLKGRSYPFTLDNYEFSLFKNILNKILNRDLSNYISLEDIPDIKRLIKFMSLSGTEVSYSTISKNLNITKYKVEKYISILEKSFLVSTLFPKGTNVRKEPKIFLSLPYRLIYGPYDLLKGYIREDFFVEISKSLNLEINYLKTKRGEKTPDFYIDKYNLVLEVGKKSKTFSQFSLDKAKHLILTDPGRLEKGYRPLFMWGMVGR